MRLENLNQPPFNTTLMGVLRGVLDYYRIQATDAELYAGSGHAFLINIHDQLCPSGPYVWKYEGLYPLLRNLGIEMTDLGFFHSGSPPEERARVEQALRAALDADQPCSLANMEHQLIHGYDDDGLLVARPWPGCAENITPKRLTWGTWQEFGKECHVNFFTFKQLARQDGGKILRDALHYALELGRQPEKYECERYGIGPHAWANWLAAIPEHGASHGNWWNATVWSECRARAADWFAEVAGRHEGSAAATGRDLSGAYREIADLLARAASKELPPDEKASIVQDLAEKEATTLTKIDLLAQQLDFA